MVVSFKIFGAVHDVDTFFCNYLADRLKSTIEEQVIIEFIVSLEVDYLIKMEELKKSYGSSLMYHRATHAVFRNNEFIGDIKTFIEIASSEYFLPDAQLANTIIFHRHVREESYQIMSDSVRPIVYIDFKEMKPPPSKPSPASPFELSRIYIQLYTDFCPQACANFIKLCTFGCRDHYVHSPVHRIVKGGWVQCGDVLDGSGLNSKAATASGFVPDESFSVDFGNRLGGTVGFANSGPHSSASQFFITLGPCEWMNNSFVGIGRVVQGYRALRYLNQVETNNQVPASPIEVDSCGLAPEEPTIN